MDDAGLSEEQFSKYAKEAVQAGLLDLQRLRKQDGTLGTYRYHPKFPSDTTLPKVIKPERQGLIPGKIPNLFEEGSSGPHGEPWEPHPEETSPEETSPGKTRTGKSGTQVTIQQRNYPTSPTGRRRSPSAHAPRSPKKEGPPQATFKDGRVTLPPELRAEWAPKFGSEEKLDRVLGMIVGKMQPYGARRVSVHNQVIGWLNVKLDDHLRDEKRSQGKDAWKEKKDKEDAARAMWLSGKARTLSEAMEAVQ
jgi:hypothetical protein